MSLYENMYKYMGKCVGVHGGQKKALHPAELELQDFGEHLVYYISPETQTQVLVTVQQLTTLQPLLRIV